MAERGGRRWKRKGHRAGAIGRPYKKFVLPAVIWPGCSYASPIWQSSPKTKTIAKLTWLSLSLPSLLRLLFLLLLLLLLAACFVATAVHLWHAMQMQPASLTQLTCPASCSCEFPPPSVAPTLPVQFYCQPPPLHAAEILQQFLTDLKSFVRKLRAFRVTLEFTGLTLIYIHIYSKIKKQNKSTLTYHIITYDTCGKYQKTLELIAGTK